MRTALDVAKYFISKSYEKGNCTLTQKKVQKLVYYAQAWCLIFLDRTMFDDELQAWVHGAVALSVRNEYRGHSYKNIPNSIEFNVNWTTDEKKVLDEVWRIYGFLSADDLEDLNHSEMPWLNARVGLSSCEKSTEIIHHEDMKYYYGYFKGQQPFEIPNDVLSLDKKITTTVEMTDGSLKEVIIDQLENFLIENRGLIREKKHKTRRRPANVV